VGSLLSNRLTDDKSVGLFCFGAERARTKKRRNSGRAATSDARTMRVEGGSEGSAALLTRSKVLRPGARGRATSPRHVH